MEILNSLFKSVTFDLIYFKCTKWGRTKSASSITLFYFILAF